MLMFAYLFIKPLNIWRHCCVVHLIKVNRVYGLSFSNPAQSDLYIWLLNTLQIAMSRNGLFTLPTRTRQNYLVLSNWRCEHNWRPDKTVLSRRVGGVNKQSECTTAMAERPRDVRWRKFVESAILRGWDTLRLNFRLKGYVLRQYLSYKGR